MRKVLLFLFFGLFCLTQVEAQVQELPKIFQLGEHEKPYENATQTYSKTLLEVCNNDMNLAFNHWIGMMRSMDEFADKIQFDLKGVKVWMHVFWNEDGGVDHIGYFLRPDSRNINTAELSAFFSAFIGKYEDFPAKADEKFSFYTGATFPTFVERAEGGN